MRHQAEWESEIQAIPAFMKARQMTWPVVFADQQFFADFGVRAVPHIAILDQQGRVVANGVEVEEIGPAVRNLLESFGERSKKSQK